MIHKNEKHSTFNIMPRNDVYEYDKNLLNEALNGLKSCEGYKIDESLYKSKNAQRNDTISRI